MAGFQRFEDIDAWQKARVLAREIYQASGKDQFGRDFGLKDQIRRASVSIMSNIAEGFGRDGNKEFVYFLSVAKASASEVRSQLYVALDQGYIDQSTFKRLSSLSVEVGRLVGGLLAYLRRTELRGSKFVKPEEPK